jgi:tRNA splicing ligase
MMCVTRPEGFQGSKIRHARPKSVGPGTFALDVSRVCRYGNVICNDNINGSDSMKYFTKELYEEMQVYGSLVFSDTKEEREDEIDGYIKEGRDDDVE